MKVSIKVEGNNAVIKNLDNTIKGMQVAVEDSINIAIAEITSDASNRVPVNTGRLKNAIDGAVIKKDDQVIGEVAARTDYAAYVEFGTGTLVDVPAGLEEYAIQYKGKGVKQVNLPAKPFLFPAFTKQIAELPKEIEKQLKIVANGTK